MSPSRFGASNKMSKRLMLRYCWPLAALAGVAFGASLLWASQGSLNVPVTGPESPTTFAGQINTAFDAVISKNSGATAPTNFPTTGFGAAQFQDWMDTSPGAGIVDHRIYDGAVFVNR